MKITPHITRAESAPQTIDKVERIDLIVGNLHLRIHAERNGIRIVLDAPLGKALCIEPGATNMLHLFGLDR